jgi:hypothetical protein
MKKDFSYKHFVQFLCCLKSNAHNFRSSSQRTQSTKRIDKYCSCRVAQNLFHICSPLKVISKKFNIIVIKPGVSTIINKSYPNKVTAKQYDKPSQFHLTFSDKLTSAEESEELLFDAEDNVSEKWLELLLCCRLT